MFSSWHLPKVLIRKSAIRACSGASTLKDQYLGQVKGGGREKKRRRGCAMSKKHHFLAQLLERSKRAKKIGDSFDFPNRTELVGGGRKAWNIPSTPTTHSQTTRCPSTWLHTHTTTTTTHKDFARNKKSPANVKRTHQHQWSSGRIHRCHRCDPGSIPD